MVCGGCGDFKTGAGLVAAADPTQGEARIVLFRLSPATVK
jgi:hypothetical protein